MLNKGCEFRYAPPSGAFARQNLIYAQYIVINLNTPQGFRMHRNDYDSYQIQFTTSGHGRLVYDQKEYALDPGDCYFIDCKKDHMFYTTGDKDWIHHGLQINGHQLPAYFQQFYSSGSAKSSMPDRAYVDQLYRHIAEACTAYTTSTDLKINQLLTELLTHLLLFSSTRLESRLSGKIAEVCTYIDENYATINDIDALSKLFFVSKYHLCREFKRQTGSTIMAYISGLRLTAAKMLLSATDLPVSEIAATAGYSSDNYFYPVFKMSEGMTPLQYRKLWRTSG